ncbi:MAG: hypothetical protein RRY16_01305 [Bacilli bacterium]
MQWLGTTKPLITFADYKLEMFSPIIKKYNWELIEVVEGLYNNKSKELCFNDSLTKENINEQDLHKRLIRTLKIRKNFLENNQH